jgi:hypothetical protein
LFVAARPVNMMFFIYNKHFVVLAAATTTNMTFPSSKTFQTSMPRAAWRHRERLMRSINRRWPTRSGPRRPGSLSAR